MFKNFCAEALGVSGRQSELIELALTYGFKGMDVNLAKLAKRAETQGVEYVCRLIRSARIRVGGFAVPVRWQGSEIDFKADLAALPRVLEVAAATEADRCYTLVDPASDELPYHENFEQHRARLAELAEVLAAHQIRLAVGFRAAAAHREGRQFAFIHEPDPLLTLIETIGQPNVGLLLDWWDWTVAGSDVERIKQLTADRIVIVRLADVPADAEREAITDEDRLPPGAVENTQVPVLLAALAALGYDGPLTPYPHPSRFRKMTRDAIVQQVAGLIDAQMQAAGLSKSGKLLVSSSDES